jgi:hypothetical protein
VSGIRWVVVIVLVLVLVGMLAFARGREHHRGDEEGAWGSSAPVVSAVER